MNLFGDIGQMEVGREGTGQGDGSGKFDPVEQIGGLGQVCPGQSANLFDQSQQLW